ncbi:MAG TPA: low affinity iron permease family protein [Candidatus Didemnitutus sp.]|nr:low affinity iron permease family protein [Candidatus Didemnitutus sp.]
MKKWFSAFARSTGVLAGHPASFMLAVFIVVVWAALGPALHFSEIWQLWINTGTTILTFLMVFLLQHTQNHDTRAIQVKLDELIRAVRGARNELINLEGLSEEELSRYCAEFKQLHEHYTARLKEFSKKQTGKTNR